MKRKGYAVVFLVVLVAIGAVWTGFLNTEKFLWQSSYGFTDTETNAATLGITPYSDSDEFPDSGFSSSKVTVDSLIHLQWRLQEGFEWPYSGIDFALHSPLGTHKNTGLFYIDQWDQLVFDFNSQNQYNVAILLHLQKASENQTVGENKQVQSLQKQPKELLLRYEYFPSKTSKNWLKTSLDSYVIPGWWLKEKGLESRDFDWADYHVVTKVSFQTGSNAPINQTIRLHIRNIRLQREVSLAYWTYLFFMAFILPFLIHRIFKHEATLRPKGEDHILKRKPVHLPDHQTELDQRVLGFVANHYVDSQLSLGVVSERLNLSEKKCSEVIHLHTGMSFRAWLNSLRIEEACNLLVKENHNISEIAYAVGYSSPAYFNRLFQKSQQCTPLQYRQKLQNSANS